MKKFISWLFVSAMLLAMLPVGVFAEDTHPDGIAVGSAAELKQMDPHGSYYLSSDITISGDWSFAEFCGTLDGNGKTVYLDQATLCGGLFTQINGADIRNLNIKEKSTVRFVKPADLEINYDFGVVAGRAIGENTRIENVTAQVNFINISGGDDIGGMVGNVRYGSAAISGCVYVGVIGSESYGYCRNVGGMVGSTWSQTSNLTISNCATYGTYGATNFAGGVLGAVQNDANGATVAALTLNGNVNYADVISRTFENAGGMIAYHSTKEQGATVICNNINYGSITCLGTGTKVGGIGGNFRMMAGGIADISGNINYGTLSGTQISPIFNNIYGGGVPTSSNNFTVEMKDTGNNPVSAQTIDEDSFAMLNAAYPDIFVLKEDGIFLKWADDAGYTKDCFTVKPPEETGDNSDELTLDVSVPEPEGTPISTAKELAAVQGTGSYYLTQDILISGEWRSPADFAGVLHGNGFSVVFNGAKVTGGLFKSISGGKIYNLTVTEAVGEGAEPNQFKAVLSGSNLALGALASSGYGTFVNVTVNCAVGKGYDVASGSATAFIGGMIGILKDGDVAIHRCVNLADLTGMCVGGLAGDVGTVGFAAEFSQCRNYGAVSSVSSYAGGMIGRHALSAARLLILENINFGTVTSESAECCGGILGYQRSTPGGSISVLRNVNYGTITNNSMQGNTAWGKPGGIIGNFNTNGIGNAVVSGNVNYGVIIGNATPNQIIGNPYGGGTIVGANNYGIASDIPASADKSVAGTISSDTLAALNQAYRDRFAMQGEQISLKWAVDAEVPSEKPEVSYTVDLTQPPLNWDEEKPKPGDDGENQEKPPKPEQPTQADTDTEEVPVETQPAKKQESGCSSALGGSFLCIAVVTMGSGAWMLKKKKD